MDRLLNDLLDACRLARGTLRVQTEPVDLAEAVRAAADRIGEAAGRGVELTRAAAPVAVVADPRRLAQIATHLLAAAVKLAGGRSRVTATVERDGAWGVVRVREGNGLRPEALPHLFDLFAPADEAGEGCLGLGLHLVKRLVELHGGEIEAKSDGPGAGTEFAVRLPLA